MSDADAARLAASALEQLHDPVALREHPLARELRASQASLTAVRAGEALRHRVLEAVKQLRPGPEISVTSAPWRTFSLLDLRYVQALDAVAVRTRLGISKSQYYRDHARAVAAIGALLCEAPAPRGQPSVASTPSPATGGPIAAERRGTLPHALTSFVGRHAEAKRLQTILAETRLLTLTGPGGVGKSRLAMHVAAGAADVFPAVTLVELAPVTNPALVPQAVSAALGTQSDSGQPPLEVLFDALRGRTLLLILDNCEHLINACAMLAVALLQQCPRLAIVATSREPLGVPGEVVWRVPPLSVPEPAEAESGVEASRFDAIRLFVERARAAQPGFALTAENAPAVAELCRRLDGIPLALELAAARLRAFAVEQILERLDDRFRLLTGGARTALPRQQTLQAALDWSYALLSDRERTLFRRLAVFAGGWTLEAAEAVCTGYPLPTGDVLGLLSDLVDRSLVTPEPDSTGAARYRLLETLRQYARVRLADSDEAHSTHDAHAHYYAALAREAEPWLTTGAQLIWLDRLDKEADNIRTALSWLEETAQIDTALELAGSLLFWWFTHAPRVEGLARLEHLLALPDGQAGTPARLRALDAAGVLAWVLGKADGAWNYPEEALGIARSLGSRRAEGHAYYGLGRAVSSDLNRNQDEGERYLREGLRIGQALGDASLSAWCLFFLGRVAMNKGSLDAARSHRQEACDLWRPTGDRFGYGNGLNGLAHVALAQGDLVAAQSLWEQRRDVGAALGSPVGVSQALEGLASVARERGDYAAAHDLLAESLRTKRDLGGRQSICQTIGTFAQIALAEGQFERAVRLAAASDALYTSSGAGYGLIYSRSRTPLFEEAERALGVTKFAAARAGGAALTMEQALAEALGDVDPGKSPGRRDPAAGANYAVR